MKTAYVCMDVESFYDATCLNGLDLSPDPEYDCAEQVDVFLNYLNEQNIKATFFVNVDFLNRCKDFLIKAARSGHEIALHCLKHALTSKYTDAEFLNEIVLAKDILQKELGVDVRGYRAPCFDISESKAEIVEKNFGFDSSVSDVKRLLKKGYVKINDALYEKNGFLEYPLIKQRFLGKSILINGGGYVRLLPWSIIKKRIFRYIERSDGFTLYVHPFELSYKSLPKIKGLSFLKKLYLTKGRKIYFKKIIAIINKLMQQGYCFKSMGE